MAPQKFADLGKEARDLINKNFHFGAVKLEVNTASDSGVKFKTEGSHNTDTGDVAATLETKFNVAPYGVAVTKKWHTDNVVSITVGIQDKLIDGLKVDLDSSYAVGSGKTAMKLKTDYAHGDLLRATLDVDVAAAPTAHLSGVVAYQGLHAGYQTSYDSAASKLLTNNFGLAYKKGDLIVNAGLVNGTKYTGSIHHQVNADLCAAAAVEYTADGGTAVTLCGNYAIDGHSSMKAKIDNNLRLGLSYVQKLRPGVSATACALINAKSLDQGGHKMGLMINFDA